jgi:hypothetical protein
MTRDLQPSAPRMLDTRLAAVRPTQFGQAAVVDSVTGLVRRERVRGFELAGGLSVLFMIGVHVLWHWGAPDTWSTPIGLVISNLGGPTATPVFVFLMGAALARPGNAGFRRLVSRGLWLFFLGYVLDVMRGFLPAVLGLASGVITPDQIARARRMQDGESNRRACGVLVVRRRARPPGPATSRAGRRRRSRRRDRRSAPPPRPGPTVPSPARRSRSRRPWRGRVRAR